MVCSRVWEGIQHQKRECRRNLHGVKLCSDFWSDRSGCIVQPNSSRSSGVFESCCNAASLQRSLFCPQYAVGTSARHRELVTLLLFTCYDNAIACSVRATADAVFSTVLAVELSGDTYWHSCRCALLCKCLPMLRMLSFSSNRAPMRQGQGGTHAENLIGFCDRAFFH